MPTRLFWVGPDMERFLAKPLSLLERGVAVALQENLEQHGHQHQAPGADHKHSKNAHSWLNPVHAITMAEQAADTLSQLDPANKAYYQARLAEFRQNIQQLDQEAGQPL